MIDLRMAKAFPERGRIAREAIAKHKRDLRLLDPFGALEKTVHHHFENGHRVVVISPGHNTHGLAGVITDGRNDNHLEVKLDSGHTIHCHEADLMPEDFPPAATAESNKIAKFAWDDPFGGLFDGQGDTLTKRAKPKFRAGDSVVEKIGGRTGSVVSVSDAGLVEIRLGQGNTMLCVESEVMAA